MKYLTKENILVQHSFLQRGFTLVELAVIISVIAILGAVTYFGFSSWRNSVAETEVRNDLAGVHAAMESVLGWSNSYPVFPANTIFYKDAVTKDVFTQSDGITLTYASGSATSYCINAESNTRENIRFFLDTDDGNKEPQPGTCP